MNSMVVLNALLYREDGHYVAHCFELDIVHAALDRQETIRDFYGVMEESIRYSRQTKSELVPHRLATEEAAARFERVIKERMLPAVHDIPGHATIHLYDLTE